MTGVLPARPSTFAVDGRGLPLSVILTPGQDGDNPQLLPLLDQIRVPRPGPGRPRSKSEAVLADKAYSHPSTRAALRARRIRFTSPERADQIARRKAQRLSRRQAPGRGPGRVQAPQRRGEMLQPAQAVPRLRHPLRQTRRLLQSRDPHRRHHPLAPMTYRRDPRFGGAGHHETSRKKNPPMEAYATASSGVDAHVSGLVATIGRLIGAMP
jgi:transposase